MENRRHLNLVSRTTQQRAQPGDPLVKASTFQRSKPDGPAPLNLYWTCRRCGVVEPKFIALNPGKWIKRTCECQKRQKQELEEQVKREAWITEYQERCYGKWLGDRWVDHRIVQELSAKTFENYNHADFSKGIYDIALAFAQNPRGNMVLCGDGGTGKTYVMCMIANYLREQSASWRPGYYGIPSLFVTSPQFFTVYDQVKKAFDPDPYWKLITQAVETPLLLIDDIDKSQPKEYRQEIYYQIIDERYKARRPTIISTNKFDRLHEYIGEYSMDRLMRGIIKVDFEGSSYRLVEE